MSERLERGLMHDLVMPTLLFVAVGAMTWAVRGTTGFGASNGCLFAGVVLGTAWWYISRDPSAVQPRPYASGWIILAMTVGFGIAGNRGWMQWPSFFNHQLFIDYRKNEFVPISRTYGFVWLFLAGIPWAGLGACLLAWCSTRRPTKAWQWLLRIVCGLGGAWILSVLIYPRFPSVFLPLYSSLQDKYLDPDAHPGLWKLIRDNREAMWQMGLYLGFLSFEIGRRDWRNVKLISTVGLVNGIGWSLLQNWKWQEWLWPKADFNFWRAWETSGGISIGIAYGIAFYVANRPRSAAAIAAEQSDTPRGLSTLGNVLVYLFALAIVGYFSTEIMSGWYAAILVAIGAAFGIAYYLRVAQQPPVALAEDPNLERWAAYTAVLFGLGISLKNGLRGWGAIFYEDNIPRWNALFWAWIGPVVMLGAAAVCLWILLRPLPRDFRGDPFPHAYGLLWFVLLVANLIAQMVTQPYTEWKEMAFSLYYVLLLLLCVAVIHYFRTVKRLAASMPSESGS